MDYMDQTVKLCVAFEHLRTGHRAEAIAASLPVFRFMNEQLFDAIGRARHLKPSYKRLYLTTDTFWEVLVPEVPSGSPISSALVLGWNKRFEDDSDYRTLLGELIRRGKRYGERDHQPDILSIRALSALAAIAGHHKRRESHFNLIVPVPSSRGSTNSLPATIAQYVGERLRCQCFDQEDIVYTRSIRKLKDIPTREEKSREINGVLEVKNSAVAGRSVLLIDDMLDTGSTMIETARALRAAGATEVHTLALARTRKFAGERRNA